MDVLLLDQGRQSLPFLRALKKMGHHVAIVCLSRFSEGYFSRYPDRRLIWPNYNTNPEGFRNRLFEYLERHTPDVTLSVGDVSAEIIANNRERIRRYTNVTVPPREVFYMAKDKIKTMAYCMENNIPCPKTYFADNNSYEGIISRLSFPVMVKPSRGIGAIGLRRFDNYGDLKMYLAQGNFRSEDLLIQEYIPQENGMQYQAEAFLDEKSHMKVCMVMEKPRFFPVTGGTSTANLTVSRPDIVATTRRLLEGIGWTGAADVDYILDPRDNIPKVIEINPRVTAGIKIGFAAGIDYADLHLRLASGLPIPRIDSYTLGVYSRNILMDVLWYFQASRTMRKNTQPSFFKFFGPRVLEQTFSLRDPFTMLGFFLHMVLKFSGKNVWREKMGSSSSVHHLSSANFRRTQTGKEELTG